MRRRNSPRVVWLPQTNANTLGDSTINLRVQEISGATGTLVQTEIPVVLDAQQSVSQNPDPSLSDIENSGYRLRRIVGKFWCEFGQAAPTGLNTGPASAILTAGLIVRRADDNSGQSMSALARAESVNPLLIENTGDPWIWRRSWTLGNNNVASVNPSGDNPVQFFPTTNFGGLSVADGPHIDQKTARLIANEERLFLSVGIMVLGEGLELITTGTLAWWTDMRVLGSLKTSIGNRRNASR